MSVTTRIRGVLPWFLRRRDTCSHVSLIQEVTPSAEGCEECLQLGHSWVHLRLCLTCGHVGCCDNSKNKHATAHFHETGHPIIESFEPGETWRWCYVDKMLLPAGVER
jgi:uncharacterized UBP type Zn finger protein